MRITHVTTARRGWIAAHLAVVAAFLVAVATSYQAPYRLHSDSFSSRSIRTTTTSWRLCNRCRTSRTRTAGTTGSSTRDWRWTRCCAIRPSTARLTSRLRAATDLFHGRVTAGSRAASMGARGVCAAERDRLATCFAWLLLRWLPVGSARSFALWSGCLLTHGMLSSVGNALLDAPSALLLASPSSRPRAGGRGSRRSCSLSPAWRARRTLGAAVLAKFVEPTPRSMLRVAGWIGVALIPALLWMDYMRSISHQRAFATAGVVTTPLAGLLWKMARSPGTSPRPASRRRSCSRLCGRRVRDASRRHRSALVHDLARANAVADVGGDLDCCRSSPTASCGPARPGRSRVALPMAIG